MEEKLHNIKYHLITGLIALNRDLEIMRMENTEEEFPRIFCETLGKAEALRDIIKECGLTEDYKRALKDGYIS